jgi:UDP-N-acetylmuramate dehydrogenase
VNGRIEQVAELLGPLAERDVPIGPLTTYRVGGRAALLARIETLADLRTLGEAIRAVEVPVLIVGRGSNVLVADRGFPGLAVVLGEFAGAIDVEADERPDGTRHVVAGGAVSLPVLARRTVAAGLTGFEWAVGVPGSVGGAVRMNAGGHGSDIAAALVEVRVFDLRSGHDGVVPASEIGLRFRGSDLGDHHVVVDARLRLRPGDRAAGEAELAEIVRWRRENQPGGQNAGSVFVNPVPGAVAAGELVDQLGLRGLRVGSAEVSPKHANFIQADEGGSADDVYALMRIVRERVREATGVLLRSEIRLVGFDEALTDRSEVRQAQSIVATKWRHRHARTRRVPP